ncbi:MAG: lysophospholipid acyltransferase family protein, partial [Marinilabiliaceae bacterium]|nr:lysophospholipid acyltransferase family protein [Marinilabiliaceae bacterium]
MSLINFTALEASGLKMPSHPLGRSVVYHWLKIDRMNALYESHLQGLEGAAFVEALLSHLEIRVEVSDDDLRHLPEKGPFIVVSNHPFGFLDGVVMLHLMRRHPDFKVMANFFLGEFAPIRDRFIAVNPFSGQHPMNVQGMRRALAHVEAGGALGIFPAGEVATVQRGLGRVEDKAWHRSMVRLICKAGVPVVPIRFSGGNSAWFHLVGKIHPYLRTLSIPSELFKKRGATIGLRIGMAVSADVLRQTGGVEEAGAYLRACVNALAPARVKPDMGLQSLMKRVQPVVDAVDPLLLCDE